MSSNPNAEIEAMGEIAKALSGLEEEAIKRVITWAASHYGLPARLAGKAGGREPGAGAANVAMSATEFAAMADLYDAANPKTGADRALVTGYWFQRVQSEADFDGLKVNNELKNLGHPVANITVAFNNLKACKPRLAMQVAKSGKSKQARKRYKLTTEGIRKVDRMIAGDESQEEG